MNAGAGKKFSSNYYIVFFFVLFSIFMRILREKATHVTFMCPMRFNKFPLDEHTCKFMVGSSNYDDTRMTFSNEKLVRVDYKYRD